MSKKSPRYLPSSQAGEEDAQKQATTYKKKVWNKKEAGESASKERRGEEGKGRERQQTKVEERKTAKKIWEWNRSGKT